ncbi:hypothetical protein F5884DRAFT_904152 [Xylogone sp. PMI_703]|nr:hypothetical protein F5884DRAFT_904152 [Xylogone sp. PMI_703]
MPLETERDSRSILELVWTPWIWVECIYHRCYQLIGGGNYEYKFDSPKHPTSPKEEEIGRTTKLQDGLPRVESYPASDKTLDEGNKPTEESTSPPIVKEHGSILNVEVYTPDGDRVDAVALLDTGCLVGNWISLSKVRETGHTIIPLHDDDELSDSGDRCNIFSVSGQPVNCLGSVTLDWKVKHKGIRVHTLKLYVFDGEHFDIVLGAKYLLETGAVRFDSAAFAPLIPHRRILKAESMKMQVLSVDHQKERLERQALRKSVELKKQQPSSGNQAATEQQMEPRTTQPQAVALLLC